MSKLRSKAHTEKKRGKRKKVMYGVLVAFVLCIGLFSWYAWDPRFHISSVEITGSSFASKEEIHEQVQRMLDTKLWGFIPKKSPMLIATGVYKNNLYAQFPPLNHIEIEIDNGVMSILVKERTATFIFCAGGASCYFMDERGFVFTSAPEFQGSSYIKFSSYTYNEGDVLGKVVIAPELIATISDEIEIFGLNGIQIQKVMIQSEQEMTMVDTNETQYLMRVDEKPAVISERLSALMKAHQDVVTGAYMYIDMRIDGKIFLKKKEI